MAVKISVLQSGAGGGGGGGMNFRGTWAPGTFAAGDVAIYSGGLYYCISSPVGAPAPAVVQSFAAVGMGIGAEPIAFPSDVTVGNLLVLFFSAESTVDPSTVSDSLGTIYTKAAAVTGYSNNAALYYGIAPSSGPNTVSFTSGGSWVKAAVMELSGVGATPDAVNSAYDNTNPMEVGITTTVANCMIVMGVGGYHSSLVYTPVTGFTISAQANGADAIAAGYQFAASAATYNPGFNTSNPGDSPVIAVAFPTAAGTPDVDTAHWTKIATI